MVWGALATGAGAILGQSGSTKTEGQQLGSQNVQTQQEQFLVQNSDLLQQIQEVLRQQQVSQQQQQGNVNTNENVSGTTTTDNLTSGQRRQMNAAIQNIMTQMGQDSPYSAANANAASMGASNAAIDRVLSQGIGNVAAQGTNFGAYNSTTQGQMASQLGADAAAAGSQVSLDTLTNFAGLDNQRTQGLNDALSKLLSNASSAGGTTVVDQSKSAEEATSQTSTGTETSTQNRDQTTDSTESKTQDSVTSGSTQTENEYDTFNNKTKKKNIFGF